MKPASYPVPGYTDPNDRRLVQMIRQTETAQRGAFNIMGVPFDGAVLGRKGARDGPTGIRRAMAAFSNYDVELGVSLEPVPIFDLGDVDVDNGDVIKSHSAVRAEALKQLRDSSLLVILGGDNSISLPSLAACSERFSRLGLIVIDSHFDLRGRIGGEPTSGSSYGLAIESLKGLDPGRVAELGVHGFLNSKTYFAKAKKLGVTVITAKEVSEDGAKAAAKRAYSVASKGADAVYLSVDLDAVDLSYVSGVSAPSAGGITAQALFELAYEVARKRKVVAADIVELAPSLDPSGKSERVAATALVYLMAGFVHRIHR